MKYPRTSGARKAIKARKAREAAQQAREAKKAGKGTLKKKVQGRARSLGTKVKEARAAKKAAQAQWAKSYASKGRLGKIAMQAGKRLGTLARVGGFALRGALALEAARGAYHIGRAGYHGYKAKQASEHLGKHAKAAAKAGYRVKKRGLISGLWHGDPGLKIEKVTEGKKRKRVAPRVKLK